MRLEKGHLIVGQDTDGLTPVLSLGLPMPKNLDSRDFSGLPEIRWQAERVAYPRLVGLRLLDPTARVPEGSQLLDGAGKIVGRITSGCHFALAQSRHRTGTHQPRFGRARYHRARAFARRRQRRRGSRAIRLNSIRKEPD